VRDRIFFPLLALAAAALVGLALVWPQGQGEPSPAPFGHPAAAPVNAPLGKAAGRAAGRLEPEAAFGQGGG
jgi:hypothetical protein